MFNFSVLQDCRSKRPGQGGPAASDCQKKIDEEYLSLMAELGEGPEPSGNQMPTVPSTSKNNFANLFDRPGLQMRSITMNPPLQNNWNSTNSSSSFASSPPPLMSNPPIPGINIGPSPVSPLHPTWNSPQNPPQNGGKPFSSTWNAIPPPPPPAGTTAATPFWPPLPPLVLPPPPPPES